MTVLYFSSTGNCLYVAKRIGGGRYSIPKLIKDKIYELEDDCIGVVFPIYGLLIPPFVEEYIKKASLKCDYLFAIATYGFFPGAVCTQLKGITTKNGKTFDYINRIKMAENCVTFSKMDDQKGDSKEQQKCIESVITDITNQKKYVRFDTPFKKLMTNNHMKNYEFPTGVGITNKLIIEKTCSGCAVCTKVCPMGNIIIDNGKPEFGTNCVSCGGCIQNCPKNALHHAEEKSRTRYRNPNVSVNELLMN